MQLRYNYRLYPVPRERQALARAFGCARVVFNDALAARQEAHAAGQPYLTDGELSARLTAAKATRERAWLGEVSAVVLQQALADLTAAYRNFFASAAGDGLPVSGDHEHPRATDGRSGAARPPGFPSSCKRSFLRFLPGSDVAFADQARNRRRGKLAGSGHGDDGGRGRRGWYRVRSG